jgi:hypothetical protein
LSEFYVCRYDADGKRTPSIWSVRDQKDPEKKMPDELRERLDPIFTHAEKEAGRWPGA